MGKPNISIKSNVFILRGEYPFNDREFIQKVNDLKALGIIMDQKNSNVSLQDWQYKLINRGMHCSVHHERERPFGIVAMGDKHVFECRCTIINECSYAKEGKCWDLYRG